MNSQKFFKFFSFLKNPLWIIVILLVTMNLLLWSITQKIGHDYVQDKGVKPTGLYKVIYKTQPNIPYIPDYTDELDKIYYELGDIYLKLR